MDFNTILKTAAEHNASDIHIVAGHPPLMRVHTIVTPMDYPVITPESAQRILEQVAPPNALETFKKQSDSDFSYEIPGVGRYRVNAHMQRKSVAMAFRAIKSKVPPLETLNLPDVIGRLTYLPRGLVLVTGDTGSGKSTTLAAMIQAMNERYRKHIITLEDPIEYAFESNKSVIEQRELGADMPSFASGLKHILRQDPDIILVGEMRDRETFEAAMHAAETGHLVFGTIHASSSSQTITRILDLFPEEARNLIRQSLVFNLRSIICQKLLPSLMDNVPRVPVCEIMIANAPIRKLIAEGRDFDINAVLKTAKSEGMQDYNTALYDLVQREWIDVKTAYDVAPNPDELKMMLKGIRSGQTGILG